MSELPRLLTLAETSEYLRLDRHYVYKAIHAGHLRAVRPGGPKGRIRVREDDLLDFLRRSSTTAGGEAA